MFPPEPAIIDGRQGFPDAQDAYLGSPTPIGSYWVSWYGTSVDDDRGCFAVVDPQGGLSAYVGDYLRIVYRGRSVTVYVVGSYNGLTTDVALTRRAYLAVTRLANDPICTPVEVVT